MNRSGPRFGSIETHTIDFIPTAERHGRPWHLFTLWFGANSVVVSIVTASLLVSQGMSFWWSVAAIVIGFAIGSFLSAFHSAQGPALGIPQMIQSRAQFGYVGGALPMVVAAVNYLIFFAAAPAICGLIVNIVWGWNVYLVAAVVMAITFVVALFGYDLSHQIGKYLSVASVVVFGIFTVLLLTHTGVAHPTPIPTGGFEPTLFLLGTSVTVIYAAGYSPYIADYSRYLPEDSSTRATAWWTFAGIFLSSVWLFVLGAYLTTITGFDPDVLGSIVKVSDAFSPVYTVVLVLVIVAVQVLQGSLSLYAGGNTMLSIVTSFRTRGGADGAGLRQRLASLIPFSVVCFAAVIAYTASFESAFLQALSLILILLVPWSAINLADFYVVRRGHYAIADMFDPRGRYGRYNVAGLVSFVVAVLVELPFANLGWFVGPIATAFDGADFSWLVGIVVSGVCYVALSRSRITHELVDTRSAVSVAATD
ncbi:cytosine permease [Nocardioides ginsengisoli]|uniref:Purine-cytosine permease family protein n=1 Tax=Nocardioides ginsengisoli TaxID=363868 RepID=A0ABW3VZE4_9ACTN